MAKCKDCNGSFGFLELKGGMCKQCTKRMVLPCHRCGDNLASSELTGGHCSSCITQRENKNILLSTIDYIPNFDVIENLGMLIAGELIIVGEIEMLSPTRTLRGIGLHYLGTGNKSTPGLMTSACEKCADQLIEQAKDLDACAVLGVKFSTNPLELGAVDVVAYGTAVKLRKKI